MLPLSFSTVNMQHVLFNNFLQLPNLTHIQSCTSQPATISTLRHKNLQTANQPPSINPPARERSLVFCWTVFFSSTLLNVLPLYPSSSSSSSLRYFTSPHHHLVLLLLLFLLLLHLLSHHRRRRRQNPSSRRRPPLPWPRLLSNRSF